MDCDTSGTPTPMAPHLHSISRTGRDTTTSRHLATWKSLSPTLQVRPLLHSEMAPSLWPGFATSLREKRLRQAYGGLLLSLCQRPVYLDLQANL